MITQPRTTEVRVALAIVAIFAAVVSASAFTGTHITGPFAQRWNLFAPAPPSAVLDLYLVVRHADGRVSEPFNVSDAVRREQVAHRFAPPSLVRPVTKTAQALEQKRASPQTIDRLRRLLSAVAPSGVASVRGIVLRTRVRRFDERKRTEVSALLRLRDPDAPPAERHAVTDNVALVFDSGWLAPSHDVAKLRLR